MNTQNNNTSKIKEYFVRKIIGSHLPGTWLAGPFTSAEEAEKESKKHQQSGVFEETWLS